MIIKKRGRPKLEESKSKYIIFRVEQSKRISLELLAKGVGAGSASLLMQDVAEKMINNPIKFVQFFNELNEDK